MPFAGWPGRTSSAKCRPGDPRAGRALFTKHCAACHKLFGEGGAVGPDLTHANRADRQFLLVSLIDHSAVIRKEYLAWTVQTTDGRVHTGLDNEVAVEVSTFTRSGVERIHRFAFELARKRPRQHLTLVTKSNAQRHGMVLWDELFYQVAKGFPDVQTERILVDAMTTRMVLNPAAIDTVVASNLHADILSDLAAALSGSLGIAPTANLNPERRFPSMFEPIHGSAFDITGKGVANPIATFWTAALMLEHLGEAAAAARIMRAVEATTAKRIFTPDLGGNARTRDVTAAVIAAL